MDHRSAGQLGRQPVAVQLMLDLESAGALTETALILTGLAVSFAFRCGLFNIGGQGQYIVGSVFAVWIGSSAAPSPAKVRPSPAP